MSVPVDLGDLGAEIARFGATAFLVTAPPGGPPHVVSVGVALTDGRLMMSAGRTSRANVEAAPAVTLLWPGAPGDDYCLLVDGTGAVVADAETITVDPTGAILHRLAGGSA